MPPLDAPGHRLAATRLKGASRYLAKLCPSHPFTARQNVSFSAACSIKDTTAPLQFAARWAKILGAVTVAE